MGLKTYRHCPGQLASVFIHCPWVLCNFYMFSSNALALHSFGVLPIELETLANWYQWI